MKNVDKIKQITKNSKQNIDKQENSLEYVYIGFQSIKGIKIRIKIKITGQLKPQFMPIIQVNGRKYGKTENSDEEGGIFGMDEDAVINKINKYYDEQMALQNKENT